MTVSRLILAGLLALALGALALAGARPGSVDDVFIVLVYARNLLESGGLFHEVEDGTLEGFTSPLDLLWKMALLSLGRDPIASAWWGATLTYGAALLAGVWLVARHAGGKGWTFLLGVVGLATLPAFAEATSYLLEVPLVVLFLWLFLGRASEDESPSARAASGSMLLAVALRPELGAAILAWCVASRSRPAITGAITGLIVATGIRYGFTDSIVPQTFFAKGTGVPGAEVLEGAAYVGRFLIDWQFLPRVALLGAALLAPWLLPGNAKSWAGPALLLATVLTGGDGYGGGRLLVPALAIGAWVLVRVASQAAGSGGRQGQVVLALVAFTGAATVAIDAPDRIAALRGGGLNSQAFEPERRALARWKQVLPPEASVAIRHLQMTEYFEPELRTLDLTGINDRAVTDYPAEGAVQFGRVLLTPALDQDVHAIHLHHVPLSPARLASRSVAGWLQSAEAEQLGDPLPSGREAEALVARYRTATLLDAGGPGLHLNFLLRRDLAAAAEQAGLWVGPE